MVVVGCGVCDGVGFGFGDGGCGSGCVNKAGTKLFPVIVYCYL